MNALMRAREGASAATKRASTALATARSAPTETAKVAAATGLVSSASLGYVRAKYGSNRALMASGGAALAGAVGAYSARGSSRKVAIGLMLSGLNCGVYEFFNRASEAVGEVSNG